MYERLYVGVASQVTERIKTWEIRDCLGNLKIVSGHRSPSDINF